MQMPIDPHKRAAGIPRKSVLRRGKNRKSIPIHSDEKYAQKRACCGPKADCIRTLDSSLTTFKPHPSNLICSSGVNTTFGPRRSLCMQQTYNHWVYGKELIPGFRTKKSGTSCEMPPSGMSLTPYPHTLVHQHRGLAICDDDLAVGRFRQLQESFNGTHLDDAFRQTF